ncbi:MgtC/SapB family protein [Paenibacillus illinoisensis]|uniref:MgtC/SapB family protein n=1 Tax=Paenibacillus illinoisensis TaxID=59845 RepID=UPI001C8EA89B|nr:MgtC/SapB family protein [Paenibacillus illinoisensis]MBY0219342.1 MgtC/SapB family protein [Paenibacillus illinoisensis]
MEMEYLMRVLIAGICGVLIGYERKNRMKEAGIRTHFVVAVGAALMMIVSKYGFQDQAGWDNLSLDPSRIAAQVVSGVGFIGAGMIFTQRHTVRGLTTAAGIWATAGMGLAVGAGLYWTGAGVTLLIVLAQMLLHRPTRWLVSARTETLTIRLEQEADSLKAILALLGQEKISVIGFRTEQQTSTDSAQETVLEFTVQMPGSFRGEQLIVLLQDVPHVRSVELK